MKNKPELKSTTEVVAFETVEQPDATLPKGQHKVVQEGINGEQIVFSEVTTVDGKQSSKVIKTSITKQPINRIIAVGTKEETTPQPIEVSPNKPEAPKPVVAKGSQEPGKEGQALTQPTLPEYTRKIETKGVQEVREGEIQGASLVQPELPEYKVSTGTIEESTETDLDFTTEIVPDDTKYVDEEVVERPGSKGVQVTKTT